MNNIERVDEHLKEKLKDPYFKELYEFQEQKLDIVKRIIDYRIAHSLTQGQLAKKAGVTQQHISKIENGDFSNILTLEKILLFIGYTVKIQAVPLSYKVKSSIERLMRTKHRLQLA
jgi:transcriptional regulator with XRE-family HTH domain